MEYIENPWIANMEQIDPIPCASCETCGGEFYIGDTIVRSSDDEIFCDMSCFKQHNNINDNEDIDPWNDYIHCDCCGEKIDGSYESLSGLNGVHLCDDECCEEFYNAKREALYD